MDHCKSTFIRPYAGFGFQIMRVILHHPLLQKPADRSEISPTALGSAQNIDVHGRRERGGKGGLGRPNNL